MYRKECEKCPHMKEIFSKTIGATVQACTKWDCVYEEGEESAEDKCSDARDSQSEE